MLVGFSASGAKLTWLALGTVHLVLEVQREEICCPAASSKMSWANLLCDSAICHSKEHPRWQNTFIACKMAQVQYLETPGKVGLLSETLESDCHSVLGY